MRTFLSSLYGLVAYVVCVAALLYLIGFSGNLLVPKSAFACPPMWSAGIHGGKVAQAREPHRSRL